jgi:transcriptional regulator with XRE-family HTH domain
MPFLRIFPHMDLKHRVRLMRIGAKFTSQISLSKRIMELAKKKHSKERLSRTSISSIENGKHSPKESVLRLIVEACDKTMQDLYESRVPSMYSNPDHEKVHEELQRLIEIDPGGKGKWLVDAIEVQWNAFLEEAEIERPKKEKETQFLHSTLVLPW